MSTVSQIEIAIEQLSAQEQLQLRDWILEKLPLEDNSDILMPRDHREKILDALDQP